MRSDGSGFSPGFTLSSFFNDNLPNATAVSQFDNVDFRAETATRRFDATLNNNGSFTFNEFSNLFLNTTNLFIADTNGARTVSNNQTLSGEGAHRGEITGTTGSAIEATTGDLTIGSSTASFNGLRTFGTVDANNRRITINSLGGAALLGGQTTIEGGAIVAANGVQIIGNGRISGRGLVDGSVNAQSVTTIEATTGNLTLGNTASVAGFNTDGRLFTNRNEVTLRSAGLAGLGTLTRLGLQGTGGVLSSTNGIQLVGGRQLEGQGTVNGQFINNGTVRGDGTGIEFTGNISGAGDLLGTTVISGTFSPGNSPDITEFENLTINGVLQIEIGGTTPGVNGHDQLLGALGLFSTLTLGVNSTLDIDLIALGGGSIFTPELGQFFDLIIADVIVGDFSIFDIPALGGDLFFELGRFVNSSLDEVLRLSVLERSDTGGGNNGTNVPEPGTLALFGFGLIGFAVIRRRRKIA